MILRTEKRTLRVDLTDKERVAMSTDLVRAIQARDEAEEEKGEVMAQYKADIERHAAQVSKVARVLANGFEMREVECRVTPLEGDEAAKYPDPQIVVVRTDTNEVVQVRAMTEEERQQALPLGKDEPAVENDHDDGT